MEDLISENLVKTEKIVIKNEQGETVRTEEINKPIKNNTTYSLTSCHDEQVTEEIPLASGESAVYVEQYSNIQDLRKAIEKTYPEKNDDEIAKDILLAINQEDIINSMSTNEVPTILEFKDTCGIGIIPTNENNAILMQSNKNTHGILDDTKAELNSYIFAAYYGKNGAGNGEFYAYTTIRWKDNLKSNLTDMIMLGFSGGEPAYIMENSNLSAGIKGYLSNTTECRNAKFVPGDYPIAPRLVLYSVHNTDYRFETERIQNDIYTNNENVTVNMDNNTVVCTSPMNLGDISCGDSCPGHDLMHIRTLKDCKLFVSGHFIGSPNKTISSFGGLYCHNKKEIKTDFSTSLSVSYNGSFSFGGSIGATFQEKYVEKEYYSPKINVQFNTKGDFYGFSE